MRLGVCHCIRRVRGVCVCACGAVDKLPGRLLHLLSSGDARNGFIVVLNQY